MTVFAEKYATDADLESLLGKLPGCSPMLKAALGGLQALRLFRGLESAQAVPAMLAATRRTGGVTRSLY